MSGNGTDTVYCRQCGSTISADATFCPDCGSEQKTTDSNPEQDTDPSNVRSDDPSKAKHSQEPVFGESAEYHHQKANELIEEYPHLRSILRSLLHPFSIRPELKLIYHSLGIIIAKLQE